MTIDVPRTDYHNDRDSTEIYTPRGRGFMTNTEADAVTVRYFPEVSDDD